MSGLTVIEAIRKTSAVPIIILSVRGDEFDKGARVRARRR